MVKTSRRARVEGDAKRRNESYQQAILVHLTRYKQERLGVRERGIWSGNRKPYGHILPVDLKHLNLLETIRREFMEYRAAPEGKAVKLHRDFHHLNSSQALAFNLFFPFVGRLVTDDTPLLAQFGARGDQIEIARFESVPNPSEGTNFDLHLILKSGKEIFVEVKFTETEYGATRSNPQRSAKFTKHYAKRLEGKVASECLVPLAFFANYQLLRNLSHLELERGDRLVIVRPLANEALRKGEQWFFDRIQPSCKERVAVLNLEDLVVELLSHSERMPTRVAAHLELFGEKYLI